MKIKRLLVIISVMGLSLGFIVANFLFANNNANKLITITASKKINLQSSDQLKCPVDKYTRKINNDGINRIHYISVGGGDATLIESNGHYGLVDSANPTYKDGTAQAIIKDPKNTVDHVIEYLKKVIGCNSTNCKGKLEFIVGTHSHSDHIGGMVKIAKVFADSNTTYYYRDYVLTSDDFLENGWYNSTKPNKAYDVDNDWDNQGYFDRTMEAMKSNNVCLEEVTDKYIDFDFGNFNIKILNTDPAKEDESICIKDGKPISEIGKLSKNECENKGGNLYARGENKNSIIQLVSYGKSRNLLAGDMEREDELRLINDENTKELLSKIQVVKLAHHGTHTSNRIELIDIMRPKFAINSRSSLYAPSMALLQQKYMSEHYHTELLMTGGSKNAIVQSYTSDGSYYLYDYDAGPSLSNVTFTFKPVKVSGNWQQYEFDGVKYWYYFDNDRVIKTYGWFKYNNKWYYLNVNGYAFTGWNYITYNGKSSWYYFDSDCAMKTGWFKSNNKWYYLSSSGAMVTGWQKINWNGKNSWFYFDKNGAMQTGWQKLTWEDKTDWYYFNSSGVMQTGWQELAYQGKMCWFYLNSSGAMVTGWQKINNEWYYFNNSGVMLTGLVIDNGKTYYLDSSGKMVHDTCVMLSKGYYCFGSSGAKTN